MELTEENCPKLTGERLTLRDVIGLAGLLRIHTYEDCTEKIYATYQEGGIIRIDFESTIFNKVDVLINLPANIISLYLLDKNKDHIPSIGVPFIDCMAKHAQKLGFKFISLHAYREDPKDKNDRGQFGYNYWGKFGFVMTQNEEINRFMSWGAPREIEKIHQVYNDKQNESDWKNEGFSWWGNFLLEEGSESWAIFDAYVDKAQKKNQEKLTDRPSHKNPSIEKAPQ